MKKLLIIRDLMFLLAITFIVSCSKKNDEVTPASVAGKWKQNGTTWKISYLDNNKKTATQDLSQAADNTIIEFNADGTAIFDGDAVSYKISGSTITFSGGGQSLEYTLKINGNNLTLSFTKEQFYKYLTDFYDANDPDIADFITIKSLISDFVFDVNYIKQ